MEKVYKKRITDGLLQRKLAGKGAVLTVTEKYKLGPKYSQRYNGYFITPGGEKVEFEGKRGTDLLKLMDKNIKILDLQSYFLSGELNENNWPDFIK